jgi:predicted Fe-Mo cluster-binding NifX family protein
MSFQNMYFGDSMRKIAVVCEGSGGLEDIVASKFARAPKIVFVELEDE